MAKQDHFYYLQQMGVEPWVPRQINLSDNKLADLAGIVANCTKCPLSQCRTKTVFARGNPTAELMIIGEAPGYNEDKQGLPFVGRAGALLNHMLQSVGLTEEEVYIANVLKCRPPENRDPRNEEIMQCTPYLTEQIELVAPKLLLALGRFAGQFLLKEATTLSKMRGQVHYYQQTPFVVSYHPAYLLRKLTDKKKAYQDLLYVKELLNKDAT
ncbi:C-terminal part of DNA polymerase, bacteriophage-type [Legionella beliardensis]|uniref:Type-4 uracil-DNA glycosylase n=1 Tax=Legionella beliardensis TaxID=91822 RepID=A0A378I2H3_9GAMM|nr:uracil-DNA glycosylase [Legionella beliardensis]STX28940.1 C-terminal part of DNA polymerase, bacteriophage-type [Legionella beliardensis]